MKFASNIADGCIIDYIVNPIFSSHITPSLHAYNKQANIYTYIHQQIFRLKVYFSLKYYASLWLKKESVP